MRISRKTFFRTLRKLRRGRKRKNRLKIPAEQKIEIVRIQFPKETLLSLPHAEQKFIIHIGHALNEIVILNKLLNYSIASSSDLSDSSNCDTVRHAQSAQTICLAKIMAGKLSVAHEVFAKVYSNELSSDTYGPLLSADIAAKISRTDQYFNNTPCPLKYVRNKYAFHHDPRRTKESIVYTADDEDWAFFISKEVGNSVFHISEIVINTRMMKELDPNNSYANKSALNGLTQLVDDIASLTNDFIEVFSELLVIACRRHLEDSNGLVQLEEQAIKTSQSFSKSRLPFFVSFDDVDRGGHGS